MFQPYNTDFETLEKRIAAILKIEPELDCQKRLRQIFSFIDLTTLSGDDTNEKVGLLCHQALDLQSAEKEIPPVAAVCVYPVFAELVHQLLLNSGIKTACVAGAFPSGQSPLGLRVDEVAYAVRMGADEIDMVISRGKLIEGDSAFVFDEVEAIKSACSQAHLKVILETGELKSVALVRQASEISILAGADFLKTSTGKITPAATPEAFLVMLDTIKEYYQLTGKKIGIKAAGGISTSDEAMVYYSLVKQTLGDEWLTKDLFRIGASRLATQVFNQLK